MTKVIFLLYGIVAYVVFLASFLYAIAFVGNLPGAPKTIDSGPPGALVPSLIVDALLLGLFAVQHSVMARPAFKRAWTKVVPKVIERSTYVLLASLVLIVMYAFWRPLPAQIWAVGGSAALVLEILRWVGWGVVLVSTFLIDHFELFGLRQVLDNLGGRAPDAPTFKDPVFYRFVRHPIYVGFIIAFWATPVMTVGHLVFALATTGYILIAIQFEEHDLTALFGERYKAYRKQAGLLWPKFGRGGPVAS